MDTLQQVYKHNVEQLERRFTEEEFDIVYNEIVRYIPYYALGNFNVDTADSIERLPERVSLKIACLLPIQKVFLELYLAQTRSS